MLSATFYLAIMTLPALVSLAIALVSLAIASLVSHVRADRADRDVAAFLATEERIEAAIARTMARFAVPYVDATDAPAFPSPVAFPSVDAPALPTFDLSATAIRRDVATIARAMARAPRSTVAPVAPVKAVPALLDVGSEEPTAVRHTGDSVAPGACACADCGAARVRTFDRIVAMF